MATGRVQVQELPDAQPLQRFQIPVDTFVRPSEPNINNDAERLAQALGHFSSTLNSIGRRKQDTNISEAVRWVQDNPDPASRVQAIGTGAVPMFNVKEARDYYMKAVASDIASETARSVLVQMKGGLLPTQNDDGSPTDPYTIYQQRVNQAATKWRDSSPFFRDSEAFNRELGTETQKYRQQIFDQGVKDLGEDVNTNRVNTIQRMSEFLLDRVGNGASDGDLVKEWEKVRTTIRSATGGGVRYGAMDDVMVGHLKARAADRPYEVERMLYLDRGKAADGGVPLGTIAARMNPDDLIRLQDTIRSGKERIEHTKQERADIDAAKRSLYSGDGNFQTIQDRAYQNPWVRSGTDATKVISAESVRKQALAEWNMEQERQAAREGQGTKPEAMEEMRFRNRTHSYVNANVPDAAMQREFAQIGTILGNPAQATVPDNMRKLLQARERYDRLNSLNPGYVKETLKIDDHTEKLFVLSKAFEEMGVATDPTDAMARAVRHVTKPTKDRVELDAETRKTIERGLNTVWGQNEWGGNRIDPNDPKRPSMIAMHRRLTILLAETQDIPPDRAVTLAANILTQRTAHVFGRAFVGDPNVSRDSVPGWERAVDRVFDSKRERLRAATDDGRGVQSFDRPDQLTIAATGQAGLYMLVTKDGSPVKELDGKGGFRDVYITAGEARAQLAEIKKLETAKVAAEAKLNIADRFIRGGFGGHMTPPPAEEMERARLRKGEAEAELKRIEQELQPRWMKKFNRVFGPTGPLSPTDFTPPI